MSVDKLVDSTQLDADLTSVANAIRTKGGTSASLAFPSGFVSAIGAISGGGVLLDDVLSNTISGAVTIDSTSLRAGVLYECTHITSVSCPNATSTSAIAISGTNRNGSQFSKCTSLVTASLPKLVGSADTMFLGCTALESVYVPLLTGVSASMFNGCTSLSGIVLPKLSGIVYVQCFKDCSSLAYADLYSGDLSRTQAFQGCSTLAVLVLRKTSSICTLSNINNFEGTPFASGGTGGTLYVPSSLVSSYESASNWSTILGYTNNQIKSIESTHTDPNAAIDLTTHYADGTEIPSS